MSIPEAIKGLMFLHQSKAIAAKHEGFNQEMKAAYRLGDSDKITQQVLQKLTPYATNIVLEEMKWARKKTEAISKETCLCLIQKTTLLPRRHIFACRLIQEELFQDGDAGVRWHLSYQPNLLKTGTKRPVSTPLHITNKKPRMHPKTREQKYVDAMGHFRQMADFLSQFGTDEFSKKLSTCLELYSMWLEGKNATVMPLSESSQQSAEPLCPTVIETPRKERALNPEQSNNCNTETNQVNSKANSMVKPNINEH